MLTIHQAFDALLLTAKLNYALFLTRQHCFKLAQARLDFARLADVAHDRIERLQAVAGDAEDVAINSNLLRCSAIQLCKAEMLAAK